MSNIFFRTAVHYFQVPSHVLDTSLWGELKSVSVKLYCYLLRIANHKSRTIFSLSDKDLMEGTGLSAGSLNTAREELKHFGLLKCHRIRIGFQYEILDPATGGSLEQLDDFNTATSTTLRGFFEHHLQGREVLNDFNGIRARCPFCNTGKPSLVMRLTDGGPWICNNRHCKRRGKLVEWEMQMANLNGESITSTEAHHRARQTLIRAINDSDEKREKETEHAMKIA